MGTDLHIPITWEEYRTRTTIITRHEAGFREEPEIEEISSDHLDVWPEHPLFKLISNFNPSIFVSGSGHWDDEKKGWVDEIQYPVLNLKYSVEKLKYLPCGTVYWVEGCSKFMVRCSMNSPEAEHEKVKKLSDPGYWA